MKRMLVIAISLVLLSLIATAMVACGSESSTGTASAGSSNNANAVEKRSSGNSAVMFTGSAGRTETYCFNGKCYTCSTTDNLTLSIDAGEVELIAEGPALTFPSCAVETGVSNNKWTLRGTFSGDANTSGSFDISQCYAPSYAGKWQGSGTGTVESGGKVKADLQCGSSDPTSKQGESDTVEWKGVALVKQ